MAILYFELCLHSTNPYQRTLQRFLGVRIMVKDATRSFQSLFHAIKKGADNPQTNHKECNVEWFSGRIFEITFFCFVVNIFDLVHNGETIFPLP